MRVIGLTLGGVALFGALLIGVGMLLSSWLAPGSAPGDELPEVTPKETVELPEEATAASSNRQPTGDTEYEPDPAWVERTADAGDIPARALRAYASAELLLREEQPGCGIGWNTLAAIGQVESHHGSIHGATLHDDGTVTPRVIGAALDGTRFDAIPDTDGGRLDDDAEWDRAIGPMQFIPHTWGLYGRDANGDGTADPDQIDDAALSAATLLCTEGGDLNVPENWITAVNAYNPSVAYNNDVADVADRYAALGS